MERIRYSGAKQLAFSATALYQVRRLRKQPERKGQLFYFSLTADLNVTRGGFSLPVRVHT